MNFVRSKKKTMRSLRFAIKKPNAELVRDILRWRPNLRTPEGAQLLWNVMDNPEIASMLVLAGADLRERNPHDNTSFLLAIASKVNNEQYQRLALLMLERGANVNFHDKKGNTALHFAVRCESMPLVVALVRKGLSVDIRNVDDETAVCIAAKCSRAAEMLRLLVDQEPFDARTRNTRVLNAIEFLICQDGDETAAISELVNLGVDVNERSDCGLTPLSLTVARGKSNLLELLVESGSDVSKLMLESNLPIIRSSYMEQSLIANLLLDQGASVNVRDEHGRNRLHIVCACSKYMPLRNIQLLLHLGADVNALDSWGNTPFALLNAESLTDSRRVYIKHLALLLWKGGMVSKNNMILVRNDAQANQFFENCLKELQKMKTTSIYDNFWIFDLFIKGLHIVASLARITEFVDNFNSKKTSFPIYYMDLEIRFNMGVVRRDMLRSIEDNVNSATNGILPSCALQRIAYHVCSEQLRILEREYYFTLHAYTRVKRLFNNDNIMVVK